jgi:hypothetical protein
MKINGAGVNEPDLYLDYCRVLRTNDAEDVGWMGPEVWSQAGRAEKLMTEVKGARCGMSMQPAHDFKRRRSKKRKEATLL